MYSDVILYLQRTRALDGLQEGVDFHLGGVANVLPVHLDDTISRLQNAVSAAKVKVHQSSKYNIHVQWEGWRERERERERG